jgi:hypothetical protein
MSIQGIGHVAKEATDARIDLMYRLVNADKEIRRMARSDLRARLDAADVLAIHSA